MGVTDRDEIQWPRQRRRRNDEVEYDQVEYVEVEYDEVDYLDRRFYDPEAERAQRAADQLRRATPPAPPPPGLASTPDPWDYTGIDDIKPAPKKPPGRGWRRTVYEASGRRLNPGPSRTEARHADLEIQARKLLRGNYRIGVVGKGGVGKTTVAVGVGSMLGALRDEDHVVAIDADTAFGKLGYRIDPNAVHSYWDLAANRHLHTFADVRTMLGRNAAGLFVLPGESAALRGHVLDASVYRAATARLDRHFAVSLVDCGATMDSPVTEAAVRDMDAMIVVSSPREDGGWAAGQTLQWLADRHLRSLLRRTVVVLNDSHGHTDKQFRAELAQQFQGHGHAVFEVPFDKQLRPGGVIDIADHMGKDTRWAFLEIAAALAADFGDNSWRRPRR